MIKKFDIIKSDYVIPDEWLAKKIRYYANHLRDLQEKKILNYSDFRMITWIVFELKELRKLNISEKFILDTNKLLRMPESFESKYEKYMLIRSHAFFLKHRKTISDVIATESHLDEMLFKLIEYDKRFLSLAEGRILKAQAFGDDRYLKRLANSIKGTNSEFKKIKVSTQALRESVAMLFLNNLIDFDKPKTSQSLVCFLKRLLYENEG